MKAQLLGLNSRVYAIDRSVWVRLGEGFDPLRE